MKVVVPADEVALVERRLAMAEGRVRSLARAVAMGVQRQVVAPVPWDPGWCLSCFPRLRLARGWTLVGYLVACPGRVRTLHAVCGGRPPGVGWLKEQVDDLEWAPWLNAAPRRWPVEVNPFLEIAVRTDGTPEGRWQLALFVRRLRSLGCVGMINMLPAGRLVKSALDLAGKPWARAGSRFPSQWLPTVWTLPGSVVAQWHERVAYEDGTEEVVRLWARSATGQVYMTRRATSVLVSPSRAGE
ncbi:MAG: hypothetical protein AB1609_12240 [Bacillota bacterium]